MLGELLEFSAWDTVFIVLLLYVIYKLFFKKAGPVEPAPPPIPPLKEQDMTVEQLRRYDGVQDERICIAVLGKIYNVTSGKAFYGPGSVYGDLAGRDGTRALATMDITLVKDEWDDHSDLSPTDLEDAQEWEQRFRAKYSFVGRLLAPGETPTDYEAEAAGHVVSDGDKKWD